MTNNKIVLSKRIIMIGITGKSDKTNAINACILMVKWHIYKCKLNEDSIFFYKFLCELKYSLVIEKTIAMREGRFGVYNNMWQEIEDYIT